MIISLIGMSGSGKTYWSQKLEDHGFYNICCDDLIENKLAKKLAELGYSGIKGVAQWLGQPYDKQFKKNQNKYLKLEKQIMQNILSKIKKGSADNLVIDTTGSIVYTGNNICSKLKKYTTIVYLKIPQSLYQEMLRVYINDPKPVIWGNVFNKQKNETNKQALKRCYPDLLQYRMRLYNKYADIVLDVGILEDDSFTIQNFLEAIPRPEGALEELKSFLFL